MGKKPHWSATCGRRPRDMPPSDVGSNRSCTCRACVERPAERKCAAGAYKPRSAAPPHSTMISLWNASGKSRYNRHTCTAQFHLPRSVGYHQLTSCFQQYRPFGEPPRENGYGAGASTKRHPSVWAGQGNARFEPKPARRELRNWINIHG